MSNIMEYKDYITKIEYSNEDKCFFGKLEMIDDLVTFEATNVEELETNFQSCVNEYLKACEQLGRQAQKTYKGVFNVRIEPELHKKIYKEAIKAGVSLNSFVSGVLSSQIKKVAV